VLELIGGGELFDFVALGGKLSEAQARYYFHQLLSGLDFMHKKGFAHRDLKPENLMLDKDFTLKIADFGFAAKIAGRDGSGLLQTQLGTASYMAPEIHLGKSYEGARVDLFAAAIILFVILTQRPPFSCANPQDPHYRLIAAGRPELFWQAHAQAEDGVDIYSPEFKDFFEKMMTLNPSHRPTMEQVLQHPWISAERGVPSYEEIKVDFQRRKQLVEAEAHNEREEKRQRRGQAHEARVVSRSGA
jgi:serine/threonine protein kinase